MLYELIGQLRADFERHVARYSALEQLMIDLPTLLADLATLKTDVEKLIAAIPVATPVDLQPAADAVAAIQTEVVKATPVPPPAA